MANVKMTADQEFRLDCICGLCDHDCMDTTCVFNKIVDSHNPEQKQKEYILSWTADVIKHNETLNKIKAGRATIKKSTK